MNKQIELYKTITENLEKKIKSKNRGSKECTKTNDPAQFLAFWDLDGTIIDGDITEGRRRKDGLDYKGLLEILIEENYIPDYKGKEGWKLFWEEYCNIGFEKQSCLFAAKCFSKLSTENQQAIRERCQIEIKNKLTNYFFTFSLKLLYNFKQQGIRNIIISASPQTLVEQVVPFLPIDKEDAYGVDFDLYKQGTDKIVTYANGKVERIKSILKNKQFTPIFCAGNSFRSDGPMLDYIKEQTGIGLFFSNKQIDERIEKKDWSFISL